MQPDANRIKKKQECANAASLETAHWPVAPNRVVRCMSLSLAWAAALGYSAAHWWPGLPLRPTLVALAVLSASRLAADVAAMWRSPLDAVERPLNATRRTRWRNLGLWPPDGSGGYAAACSAMAERVGDMAGVGASTRAVLDVGCGAGESLRIWSARGAALVVGVDAAPPVDCSSAVECCDAAGVGALAAARGERFDAVVCVDAAYHFAPSRAAFFAAASSALSEGSPAGCPAGLLLPSLLKPPIPHPVGGRIGLADVLGSSVDAGGDVRRASRGLARRAIAALMRVPAANLCDAAQYEAMLASAGFVDVTVEPATERVVGGFARFAARHARSSFDSPPDRPGWSWSSVARAGAALSAAFRHGQLEYVFVSARKRHSPRDAAHT